MFWFTDWIQEKMPDAYSWHCYTSMVEIFAKIDFIIDVQQGLENTSDYN